jgi:hypothetical protein
MVNSVLTIGQIDRLSMMENFRQHRLENEQSMLED